MAATDAVITLAGLLKIEAPAGGVRLCDGGFLTFGGETYESLHPVFGTLAEFDAIEDGFGDLAEGGGFALTPAPDAALADWFRPDLSGCRVRMWMGEVDADGFAVSTAELLADLLIDTVRQRIGAGGERQLILTTMSRAEKLFLKNEGNVLSQRFHQTVWAGEKGLNNCTDLKVAVAWGTASPPRGGAAAPGPVFRVPGLR